jgi:hypothetical protein
MRASRIALHNRFGVEHAALRVVAPDGDDSEPCTWQELIENPIDIAMNHIPQLGKLLIEAEERKDTRAG